LKEFVLALFQLFSPRYRCPVCDHLFGTNFSRGYRSSADSHFLFLCQWISKCHRSFRFEPADHPSPELNPFKVAFPICSGFQFQKVRTLVPFSSWTSQSSMIKRIDNEAKGSSRTRNSHEYACSRNFQFKVEKIYIFSRLKLK